MYTGLHVMLGQHNQQVVDLFAELHAAGTPVPCATVLNDLKLFGDIKAASPSTWFNFRYRPDQGENPPADHLTYQLGREWWVNRRGNLPLGEANCYQICNEFDYKGMDYGAFGSFFQGMMDAANDDHAKVCIGNISSANPEPSDFAALAPMLRQAEAQGHVLVLHLYSPNSPDGDKSMYADRQDYVDRWIPLIRPYPNLNVLFAEEGNGSANYQGAEQTLVLMKQCEEIHVNGYARICKLKGGCYWSWGSIGGWGRSAIDGVASLYIKWRKSMGGQPIPSSPTPPTLGEAEFVAYSAGHQPDEPVIVRFVTPNTPEFMFPLNVIIRGEDDVPPAPLPPPAPESWTVATTAVLNVRAKPNITAPIVAKYAKGTRLSVIAADATARAATNGYVQVAGQPDHWVAYQWLSATA